MSFTVEVADVPSFYILITLRTELAESSMPWIWVIDMNFFNSLRGSTYGATKSVLISI